MPVISKKRFRLLMAISELEAYAWENAYGRSTELMDNIYDAFQQIRYLCVCFGHSPAWEGKAKLLCALAELREYAIENDVADGRQKLLICHAYWDLHHQMVTSPITSYVRRIDD